MQDEVATCYLPKSGLWGCWRAVAFGKPRRANPIGAQSSKFPEESPESSKGPSASQMERNLEIWLLFQSTWVDATSVSSALPHSALGLFGRGGERAAVGSTSFWLFDLGLQFCLLDP